MNGAECMFLQQGGFHIPQMGDVCRGLSPSTEGLVFVSAWFNGSDGLEGSPG